MTHQKKFVVSVVIGLTFLALIVFALLCRANKVLNKVDTHLIQMKSGIGKKLIIENDTVTILNYNMFGDTYELSDGREVGAKIFYNKIINYDKRR